MRRRVALLCMAIAAVCLVCVAGPATATGFGERATDGGHQSVPAVSDHGDGELVQDCAADPPDDYGDPAAGNGVVGWVDGYWYDEPLEINATGGLTRSEVERLAARTTARFEAMRCLAAVEGVPPVTVQSRDEFRDDQSSLFDNVSTAERLFDNAMFETTLLVSSEKDTVDERESNRGATVGGTYDPAAEEITIVSDDPDSLLIDEEILAHEVGHAIQDQQFNLTRYDRSTTDRDKGINGLVEGDVSLVEHRYLQACDENAWEQPCVTENFGNDDSDDDSDDGGADLSNWGLYFINFQPYSDGPSFVETVYENGSGWGSVDALYDDPPGSALYVVFPDLLGEAQLANVTVPDRSNDEYERLTFEEGPNYDTLGVAGISAMFMAPAYNRSTGFVFDPSRFLNLGDDGNVDEFDPLEYAHPQTEGWRGDKLYVYANDANETGSVWKLVWANEDATRPFLRSYEQLVDVQGGERVDGYEYTYTFGDDSAFDMALTIVPDGDTVTVVTAPAVEELTGVHDVDLVETDDEVSNAGTDSDGGESGGDSDDGSANADGDGSGFGVLVGGLAVLLAGLVLRRRG